MNGTKIFRGRQPHRSRDETTNTSTRISPGWAHGQPWNLTPAKSCESTCMHLPVVQTINLAESTVTDHPAVAFPLLLSIGAVSDAAGRGGNSCDPDLEPQETETETGTRGSEVDGLFRSFRSTSGIGTPLERRTFPL